MSACMAYGHGVVLIPLQILNRNLCCLLLLPLSGSHYLYSRAEQRNVNISVNFRILINLPFSKIQIHSNSNVSVLFKLVMKQLGDTEKDYAMPADLSTENILTDSLSALFIISYSVMLPLNQE